MENLYADLNCFKLVVYEGNNIERNGRLFHPSAADTLYLDSAACDAILNSCISYLVDAEEEAPHFYKSVYLLRS